MEFCSKDIRSVVVSHLPSVVDAFSFFSTCTLLRPCEEERKQFLIDRLVSLEKLSLEEFDEFKETLTLEDLLYGFNGDASVAGIIERHVRKLPPLLPFEAEMATALILTFSYEAWVRHKRQRLKMLNIQQLGQRLVQIE